jgi:hypothetical protein
MNPMAVATKAARPPVFYWRLWLFDTVLVVAGLLFFLAAQYGTPEFLGPACLMALLPLIPAVVLVGGAGSTIFVLSKVLVEKRGWPTPAALALLVGPAIVLAALLALPAFFRSPAHRLDYICLGNAPSAASQIHVSGYSTFLREEWLAAFNVSESGFQTMIAQAKLAPVDEFEFRDAVARSPFQNDRLFSAAWPPNGRALCYKRVFNAAQEHERGTVFAMFDRNTSTAIVLREFRD